MRETPTDEWGRTARSGNKAIDDPKERMMERLRKLLEVQNRAATEAEAQQAATLLQRFLTEHNLSVADLERRGQTAPQMAEGQHDLGKAAWKWKLDLAEGIAEFYYCAPLVDRRTKTVAFAGRPDNVEALTMLYAWVCDQIKQVATSERRSHFESTGEHIDPLRWQINFGEGAAERIIVASRGRSSWRWWGSRCAGARPSGSRRHGSTGSKEIGRRCTSGCAPRWRRCARYRNMSPP